MSSRRNKFLLIILTFFIVIIFTDTLCIFKLITGLPCPGCGLTRATLSALKLNFKEAFFFHPLFLLPPPLIIVGGYTRGNLFNNKRINSIFWLSFIILFITTYTYRMITMFPTTIPMDYNYNSFFYKIYLLTL